MNTNYDREIEINNFNDYIEKTRENYDPLIGEFYYRGHRDIDYEIIPSLSRKICEDNDDTKLLIEQKLINE